MVVAINTELRGRLAQTFGPQWYQETLARETGKAPQFIDITDAVLGVVERSGITCGMALVFSKHTTAAICVNEHEPLLIQDLCRKLAEIAPSGAGYRHDDFSVRTVNMQPGERENGHSHCQQLFLGVSETLPISHGQLVLGRWQSIFLVELDGGRTREVSITVLGV